MRTGILGGTFDPIHVAHLHTAEVALHQLDLDRVLFIPAGSPWQKAGRDVSPGHHRLEMCHIATAGVPGFQVDDREMIRDGPSYTIDTLETFDQGDELFLILGSDAASRLHTWERWEDVVARVTVVVAPRPGGHSVEERPVLHLEMGLLEISGTEIRRRASLGLPYRYLVTEPVHAYIESVGLYANDREGDMVGDLKRTEDSS